MNEKQAAGFLKRVHRESTTVKARKLAVSLADVPYQDAIDSLRFFDPRKPFTSRRIRAQFPKVDKWRVECVRGAKAHGLIHNDWPENRRLDDKVIAKLEAAREREQLVSVGAEPPEFDAMQLPSEES